MTGTAKLGVALLLLVAGCASIPLAGVPRAGDPLAGDPLAGDSLPGNPLAGVPLAGVPLAGVPLAGVPLAGNPLAGEAWLAISVSAVPNLGVAATAGQVFDSSEEATWSVVFRTTYQFLDDEDFAGDGNPAAGDWTQFDVGVRCVRPLQGRRHWTSRYGFTWFRAEGEPNIVQEPGDYTGLYAGVGLETELTEHASMGPELTLIVGHREQGSGLVAVPQLNFALTWRF